MKNEINFGYAEVKEILPVIAKGIENKVKDLQFFGNHESDIHKAVSYLITFFYIQSSKLYLSQLYNVVTLIAKRFELFEFYNQLKDNQKFYERKNIQFVTCESKEKNLIAVGKLTKDYSDSDPDPYETAGGYRNWKALKGTTAKYYLNDDLTVSVVFESNCIVDHYNNNINGLSTGGGTTKYKIGDRVEKRNVNLGREFISKGWTKTELKAQVYKIDVDKIINLCNELYPEFTKIKK